MFVGGGIVVFSSGFLMEYSVSQRRPVRRAIPLSLAAGSGRTWPGQKAVALAGTKRNQPRNQAKT